MRYLSILILILFFSTCTSIEKKEKIRPTIFEYFDIDTSWHYVNKKFSSCFEDTIDSYLEIRLSTQGTFFQPNKYLHLKYDGIKWKGIIGQRPMIVGDSSFEKEIIAKIGWKRFEDSLIAIDIKSLRFRDPEKDSIDRILDGESLILEIITPNQYKIFSFHEPEILIKNAKKSNSLLNFKRFFELINNNFNNYYCEKR